jgi:P27 family predicted phage terminase small subunit
MKLSENTDIPQHLSKETQAWYVSICEQYVLESHHRRLLQLACEAWDRSRQAREVIERDGLTFINKHGDVKPHPCASMEQTSRIQFARLMRELNLDLAPEDSRTPELRRYRR